jgi:hypothetical protein
MLDECPQDVLLVLLDVLILLDVLVLLDVLLVLLVLLDVLPLLPHQLAVLTVVVKNTLSGSCLHSVGGDSVMGEIGKDQFLASVEFFRQSAGLVRNDCPPSVEHLSCYREQTGYSPGQDAGPYRSYCQCYGKHFLHGAV